MEHECFFCRQPLVPNEGNIQKTPCCHQRVHFGCQKQWCLEYFHCGYCRTSVPALEPMPGKFRDRFRITEFLLSGESISSLTVTVVGAGSEVDDDSLMSAVREDLGNLYRIFIERDGRTCEGFRSGRISRVKIATEDRHFFVVNNPMDTGSL